MGLKKHWNEGSVIKQISGDVCVSINSLTLLSSTFRISECEHQVMI